MRRIGLLGGASWRSTISYYRYINEEVGARLGGHHTADLIVWSGDFGLLAERATTEDREAATGALLEAAGRLKSGGAEILVLVADSAQAAADQIEAWSGLPVVNAIDVTARRMEAAGVGRAALLGTAQVMEDDSYQERMEANGIECLVPGERARREIDRIIGEELLEGVIDDGSHRFLLEVIDQLADEGAEGAILGCTELGLILDEDDGVVPGFDTTRIHSIAAVDAALL